MVDESLIRIVCPFDGNMETFERSRTIICIDKGEFISRDFPRDRPWGYCNGCQIFWPLKFNDDGEVEGRCPACKLALMREEARLCGECEVLSLRRLESPKVPPNKAFTVSSGGGTMNACAGCRTPFKSAEGKHSCEKADVVFASPRGTCPFCEREIGQATAPDIVGQPHGEKVAAVVAAVTPGKAPESESAVTKEASASAGGDDTGAAPATNARRKKNLGRSKKQWVVTVGLLLSVASVLLGLFPPPVLSWYCHRYIVHRAPIIQPINFSKREVLESQKIEFKALIQDHDHAPVKCRWSSTAGHLDEHNCEAVLDTAGVSPQAVPIPIRVDVEATDSYDVRAAGGIEVYVLPVTMVNKPPILEAIRPSTQEVRSGDQVSLFAITRNPDKDPLTYIWNASSGQVTGSGDSAILNTSGINPQSITPVVVTLRVDDGRDGTVTGNVTINVIPKAVEGSPKTPAPLPPVTNNKSPKLLSLQPQKSTVLAGESVGIDAVANDEDQDRLDYIWEPADRIVGSGASVTLKTLADDSKGEVKPIQVRLTVFDRRGGSASQLVFIYVLPQPKTASPALTAAPPAKPEEAKGGTPAQRPL